MALPEDARSSESGFIGLMRLFGLVLQLLRSGNAWATALRRKDFVGEAEMVKGLWALAMARQHRAPAMRWLANRLASPTWAGRGSLPDVVALRSQVRRPLWPELA